MKTEHETLRSQLDLLSRLRSALRSSEETSSKLQDLIVINGIGNMGSEMLNAQEEDFLLHMQSKLRLSDEAYLSLTREQVISAARVMARNLPVEDVSVGDYLGLKFKHIFIGIEKDGYAHS